LIAAQTAMFAQTVAPELHDPHVGRILGVKVSGLTMDQTVQRIADLARSGGCHQVCTANTVGVVLAQSDEGLADIYDSASLVTCDSEGVRWAMRRQGQVLERVAGIEVVEKLCEVSARTGLRLFFYGARPGVGLDAAEKMMDKYPGAVIVGAKDGYQGTEPLSAQLAALRSLNVDVLLVGMGIPKQERVAFAASEARVAGVSMGVGGSFDVLSGRLPRAPLWMRQARTEWLWRLLIDWRKVRRLGLLPAFVWKVLRDR
jgi:N-acetylglucosaminyldiphosphoundecaprenol N-acetyl-beta-D-mannosaminyltransferase